MIRTDKPKYVNEVMVVNVEKIKRMRLELDLTQQELAEMIGVKHKASISKIEKGKHNCTLGMLNRLAKAFGCSPLSLILIKEEQQYAKGLLE